MTMPPEEFPLWPKGAPGATGSKAVDIPTLTPFLPEPGTATGAALVIFPGGGYEMLAGHEGKGYAEFFVKHGITCFVLKYRLGSNGYRHPRMLEDAARAVRLIRSNAAEWEIDSRRVGIIGSSAGGHLAATLATHFDAGHPDSTDPVDFHSSRPDLAILCYPVISFGEHGHTGSMHNLLGNTPAPELVEDLSNELRVTRQTPPCFVWHTWEDEIVSVENSLLFAAALRKARVRFDLHVYQQGIHGIGLGKGLAPDSLHPWSEDCVFWLHVQGFTK